MKIRRSLLKDTVTVETYLGEGAYGPVYDSPVVVHWAYEAKRRLVRDANGDEAVSEGAGQAHPDDAARFTPESRLMIDGRYSTVLTTSTATYRGRPSYLTVTCS